MTRKLSPLYGFYGLFLFLFSLTAQAEETPVRIHVTQFKLENFKAYPKQGITEKNLQAHLQSLLEKLGPDLTLQQVHGIADEITTLYRNAGLMMARALVLPQEIQEGVIRLHIQEGVLGEVVVSGEQFYRAKTIARPFLPLLRQTVQKNEIQSALSQVENLPGINVFGYFSTGKNPGETRVNLKVLEETFWPWNASLRLDDHGTEQTGQYRLYTDFTLQNLTGSGESVKLGVLQSLSEESTTLGYLNLSTPFFHPKLDFSLYHSNTQFKLGEDFKVLEVEGLGHQSSVKLSYTALKNSAQTLRYSLQLDSQKTSVASSVLPQSINSESTVYDLQGSVQWGRRFSDRIYQNLRLSLIAGQTPDAPDESDENFVLLQAGHQWQWVMLPPSKRGALALDIRTSFNWSHDPVPAAHQLSLTGPSANRAFGPNDASTDLGFHTAVDLFFPIFDTYFEWLQKVRPFIFLDYSAGTQLAADTANDESETDIKLASVGIGFNYSWQRRLLARFHWGNAFKQTQSVNGVQSDLYDSNPKQGYFSVTYLFDG